MVIEIVGLVNMKELKQIDREKLKQRIKALKKSKPPKVYNLSLEIVMEGEIEIDEEHGINAIY